MDESFKSDFTYCPEVEKSNDKIGNPNKPRMLLKDVINIVQSHMEGKYFLPNYEVQKYLEYIGNLKANSSKLKKQIERLRSILNVIYKKNRTFEENMSQNSCVNRKDPFDNFEVSQDMQMLCNFNQNLEPISFPVDNDNQTPSFRSHMLTNQNFISDPDDGKENSPPRMACNSNVLSIIDDNFSTGFNNGFIPGNELMYIDTEIDTSRELNATVSINTDILSGHNFINSSQFFTAPAVQLSNNESDKALERSQNIFDQSEDIFSPAEPIDTEQYKVYNMDTKKIVKIDCSKKLEDTISVENMSVGAPLSQRSTNFSGNSSFQMIISDSFCDKINADMNDYQRRVYSEPFVFKKPYCRSTGISDNDVITSTQKSEESTQKSKDDLMEKTVSLNKTFEDSCDDLCQLTTKFLKIVDERDVGEDGRRCVDVLKSLVDPSAKKDVRDIGELNTFFEKSYNKKMNNVIHSIGSNSTSWEESSEDIENVNQINQEISHLLKDALESIDSHQDNKDENFDALEKEVAKCLDPEHVEELDLKTLLKSNFTAMQDKAKNFKKYLLTDNYFQSNASDTDEVFDWRK